MMYTVISAWICFYTPTVGQFNWVLSDHRPGPLVTAGIQEETKMSLGCELIDYVWEKEKHD